jgi:iron complex outermembrane receptor protein
LRASIGNDVYNNVNSSRAQLDNLDLVAPNNLPTQVLETNFESTPDVILSDFYVEDASFIRMDNITLGYTLRGFDRESTSLRFWMGLQNAFVITDYSGVDPEVVNFDLEGNSTGLGIDNTIYPRGRTYLLGINYNF